MVYLTKTNKMPASDDWAFLGQIIAGCVTFVICFFKGIDAHFAYKSKMDRKFIEDIVGTTMQNGLTEVKADIRRLEEHRENDRVYFDGKFDKLMSEVRKAS